MAFAVLRKVWRGNTVPRLATDHAEDGRPIVVEGAVAVEAERTSTRRIIGVAVRTPLLAGVLVHLVGLHGAIGQG